MTLKLSHLIDMRSRVGHSCDLGVGHSCDLPPPRLARVSSHFLLMIYCAHSIVPRSEAAEPQQPHMPPLALRAGGSCPRCCTSALTKFEIANGEAFENPARVLGCAASECMSRPSGRLQLAPAGHVRSIVNSVRERVRACVRDARKQPLSSGAKDGQRCARTALRGSAWCGFWHCQTAVTMGAKAPIPPARGERFCVAKSSEYTLHRKVARRRPPF